MHPERLCCLRSCITWSIRRWALSFSLCQPEVTYMVYSTMCLFPNLAPKGNMSEDQNWGALLCARPGEQSLTRLILHVAVKISTTLEWGVSEGSPRGCNRKASSSSHASQDPACHWLHPALSPGHSQEPSTHPSPSTAGSSSASATNCLA